MNSIQIVGTSPTMTSRDIAELVESRHDVVKLSIERLAKSGVISQPPLVDGPKSANGVVEKHYLINKRDSYVVVAQLCPEFTARLVDRWQELESMAVNPAALSTMDILKIAMEAEQGRLLAIEQRDAAISTKAEIGGKREATAMNTASQATKKANRLEIELDKSKEYATVKRVEMLYHGTKFNWRLLKSTAAEMEIPPIDVFDANYGTVKAYHSEVWREAYAVNIG